MAPGQEIGMREAVLAAAVGAAFAFSGLAASAGEVPSDTLTGAEAFGSWEQAKPGVTRLIKPSDLPPPFNTKSASNSPGQADKPADAKPLVPEGFTVSEFA